MYEETGPSRRSRTVAHVTDRYLLPERRIESIDEYLATEIGGLGLQHAIDIGPDGTIALLTQAGLRGRGGAGFPTGTKWASVRSQPESRRFAVCNGAEGEPGTFKDRALLRTNPYQVVEGLLTAAFVVDAERAYIALKESFEEERARVTQAIIEMQDAGICRDCEVVVVAGPEEYLYGEEKALLEVIEGNPPLPRVLPPYQHGLFATAPQLGWSSVPASGGDDRPRGDGSNPTLVNNVETLANVPHILVHGADWFRSHGTDQTPGNVVCTVVGDVVRAAVDEVEPGTSLRDVITAVSGGPHPGRSIKAVFSGVTNPVVRGDQLDVELSYEGLAGVGSGMGACGFIVYDDTTCMVEVAAVFSQFLFVESCGQCPPCKLGSAEITIRLDDLQRGTATELRVEEIWEWLAKVTDGSRCFLATEEAQLVGSIIEQFPREVEEHVVDGCPRPRHLTVPKLVDLRDGDAVYDERQARKKPDWTYD
jgi:NADH:ubiquinone oxidoreductase subunit F (NADH-binding)